VGPRRQTQRLEQEPALVKSLVDSNSHLKTVLDSTCPCCYSTFGLCFGLKLVLLSVMGGKGHQVVSDGSRWLKLQCSASFSSLFAYDVFVACLMLVRVPIGCIACCCHVNFIL
jgi:hypothetical protein